MRKRTLASTIILSTGLLALYACGERATLPLEAGIGPNPTLPPPHAGLLPTMNVAPAAAWPANTTPTPGLAVTAFATGLDHPRWLTTLPNGDILVAETNSPQFPADSAGLKGFIGKLLMKRAGAGVPSPNRITLLRPQPNGPAQRFTFATNLHSPFGMALVGTTLYVADTDALFAFPYTPGATTSSAPPTLLTNLPGGPIDHHWTKNVIPSPDGTKLYVSVGSNSNVAETASPRKTAAPPSGKSTAPPAPTASTPTACATPWASPTNPPPAPSGPASTNATKSAPTSSPTT